MASSKRRRNKKLHQRRRRAKRPGGNPATAESAGPAARLSRAPSELDQMSVFIAENELGLAESSLADVRAMASRLPFEAAMLGVVVLMGRVERVLRHPSKHWEVAQQFYADRPELLAGYQEVLRAHPERTIFSPQPLMLLMRLLLDHAVHEPLRDLTPDEFRLLQDGVLAAHSALEAALDALPMPSRDHMLAYELQASTLFRRPQPLEEMTRHQELRRLATVDERLKGSANRVPVDNWLAASGITADEQWAVGFGLSAMTRAFTDSVRPRALADHVDDLLTRLGQPDTARELPALSASRAEVVTAFQLLGGGHETLAWEARPFKSKPFLRLANGDLLLLSPSWLLSWLGEGFHYRALTQAQTEGSATSAKYTRLMGEVVERYALDLAEAAVSTPGRVFGEQPYGTGDGQRTSDVAVVCGEDLVLFEIHARRVAATAAVTGTATEATLEVSRLLVAKIDQLGPCIGALLSSEALLPDSDIETIKRIWPVVVSAGHIIHTQNLWSYLRSAMDPTKAGPLADQRVQPLQVLDIEDYEKLMGLVEAGENLPKMLARKASGPFRERDFGAWLHGDKYAPSDRPRPSVLKERWNEMAERVTLLSSIAAEAEDEGQG